MRTVTLLSVVAIVGCQSPTASTSTLSGNWISTSDSSVVLSLHLREQGDTLTGDGTYAVVGGRSGTFVARGDHHPPPPGPPDGPTINLLIAPDSGGSSSFVGHLDASGKMIGILSDQSSSKANPVTFARQ